MAADEQELLENMLLEAAGRGPKGSSDGKRQNKRRRTTLPPQISSSDDDHDFNVRNSSKYEEQQRSIKKGKVSKMPVKKRLDDAADEDDGGNEAASESDLSFGSDLYKDDQDRKELENMSELQREMILLERAEMRDNLLRKIHRQTQRGSGKGYYSEDLPSSRIRSSVRGSDKSSKAVALNALVAKKRQRAEGQNLQRKHQGRKTSRPEALASEEEWERESSPSHEDKEDEEEDDDDREEDIDQSDCGEGEAGSDEEKGNSEELPDKELIKSITIRRSKLLKWFMEPFFEEVIVGCLVKIGTGMTESGGNEYKLYLVQSVDSNPNKRYKFENRVTFKHLNCTGGDDSTSISWQMLRVSDQVPEDTEIMAWLKVIQTYPGHGITKSDAINKRDALAKINTFIYSAATVRQMLEEKKQASVWPSNIALEKDRLLKELAMAESKGEMEDVQRLQDKLKDLEDYSLTLRIKNIKAERIEMMNRKNKMENFKNASELRPANPHAKAGEAGYDPFSRRWTRSQNYYKSDPPNLAKGGGEGLESNVENDINNAVAALEADGKAFEIQNLRAVEREENLYNLHDFDLPISSDVIEQFKGAMGAARAFMERRRYLEARYDVRVENNDGIRHNLTLTVNDYKRRQGLL